MARRAFSRPYPAKGRKRNDKRAFSLGGGGRWLDGCVSIRMFAAFAEVDALWLVERHNTWRWWAALPPGAHSTLNDKRERYYRCCSHFHCTLCPLQGSVSRRFNDAQRRDGDPSPYLTGGWCLHARLSGHWAACWRCSGGTRRGGMSAMPAYTPLLSFVALQQLCP